MTDILIANPPAAMPLKPLYRATPVLTPTKLPAPLTTLNQTPAQLATAKTNITAQQLQTQGLITIGTPDASGNQNITLNQSMLASLTPTQINQLNSIGIPVTQAEVTQAQEENDLQTSGVITVSSGQMTLAQPLSSLSPAQIKQLNDIGFNITQTEVTNSNALSDLQSKGIVDQSGNLVQSQIASLSPNDISELNTVGIDVTQAEVTQASAIASAVSSGLVTQSGNNLTLNSAANLTQSQITTLLDAGFTQAQITQVQQQATQSQALSSALSSGLVTQNGNNLTLSPTVSGYSHDQISTLLALGFTLAQITNAEQQAEVGNVQHLYEPSGSSPYTTVPEQIVVEPPSDVTTTNKLYQPTGASPYTTTPLTSAQINADIASTQTQQSSAINTLLQNGIIAVSTKLYEPTGSSPYKAGPTLYTVTSPLTLSPADVDLLEQAGFNISAAQIAKINAAQELINSGIISISNNTIKLLKTSNLSSTQLSLLQDFGVNLITPMSGAFGETLGYYNPKTGAMSEQIGYDENGNPVYANLIHGNQLSPAESRAILGMTLVGTIAAPFAEPALAAFAAGGVGVGEVVKKIATGQNLTLPEAIYAAAYGELTGQGILSILDSISSLSTSDQDALQRAITIRAVPDENGVFNYVLDVEVKSLPSNVAGLVKTELDPISGKTILVGIGKVGAEGVTVPMALEMPSEMWDEFMVTKELGPEYLQGALLKYMTPEQYNDLLTGRLFTNADGTITSITAEDIAKMTPEQIYGLIYKEIGEGSPYSEALNGLQTEVLKGTEPFSIQIKGAVTLNNGTNLVENLFNKLISDGLDESTAALITSRILSDDMQSVSDVLKSLNLTDQQTAEIVAIRVEAGGLDSGGTAIYRTLAEAGVPADEIPKVIEIMASKFTGVSDVTSSGGIPMNFSNAGLKAIVETVDEETLANAEFTPEILNRIVTVMSDDSAALFLTLLPAASIIGLDSQTLTHSMLAMTPEQVNTIMNKLSTENLTTIIPKLDVALLNQIIPVINQSQLNQIVPILNQAQLNSLISSLTSSQVSAVIQSLSVEQLTSLTTQLTTEQIQTFVETGTIPTIPTLPPIILKPLLAKLIVDNTASSNKMPGMYQVQLQYYSSSQTYKIRANSFQGAANQALMRRLATSIPITVTVKKILDETS